jgi:hypothetical protein
MLSRLCYDYSLRNFTEHSHTMPASLAVLCTLDMCSRLGGEYLWAKQRAVAPMSTCRDKHTIAPLKDESANY